MKIIRNLMVIAAFAAVSATSAASWAMAGDDGQLFINANHRYSLRVPAGWMYPDRGSSGVFSRYGRDLQRIEIGRVKIKRAFRVIDVRGNADMLPQELAELFYANTVQARDLANAEIVSDEPTEIDGALGFRLDMRYSDGEGLTWREVHYGAVLRNRLITLSYVSPELHYFDEGLQPFEELVASFDDDVRVRRR